MDIGSASFKYDMRRLTEILAFPKAWYRRSIIRRLFLGDLTRAPVFSDGEDESGPDHSEEYDHESGMEDDRLVNELGALLSQRLQTSFCKTVHTCFFAIVKCT